MTERTGSQFRRAAGVALALSVLFPRLASADVTLIEKDDWTVFTTGRIQTFGSFADGNGRPRNVTDANCRMTDSGASMCNQVELRGGGIDEGDARPEWPVGTNLQTSTDPGHVREFRIRTGFTGNVLGFGIKRRLTENTVLLAFTSVTVGIDSDDRRKYSMSRPDWRESYLRVIGPAGTLTAGRALGLYSRGATEITFLYGYRYGLGFPGGITPAGISTAGSIGFGVLANGFGAGVAYATPDLAGLQLTVGVYDANNIVGTRALERTRWPRGEAELTFTRKFGTSGLIKLFGNGAAQRVYDQLGTPRSADVWGVGYGGRFELGPVKFGMAGHYGKGVGLTYAYEPNPSLYYYEKADADPTQLVKLRTVAGYYAQAQISPTPTFDIRAGAGISMVFQLPDDLAPVVDKDMGMFATPSVGWVTMRQQIGIGAGLGYHVSPNFHLSLEYFRASFQWYKPTPAPANAPYPAQAFNFVNFGATYDF